MKHYTLDGSAVAALREAAGLTQVQLAKLVGIGPDGISRLESGARQPSPQTARRIADALGVEFAAITRGGRRDIAKAAPALREIAGAS
jgi:transcriptional regulator with XRE-family HTH domain